MNFYYDKESINDVDSAIPLFSRKEFQSSARSTVPLISWLKHEQPMVSALLRDLGIPADCTLHLEYSVAPQRGKGMGSRTDLMAIAGESSLAVEAKWTEQRYETVGKWLKNASKLDNHRDVLTGWLGLLQKHAVHELRVEDFYGAVYQMVHRAASVCAAGATPTLAYLVFKPSPVSSAADSQTIHNDLTHLWRLLGRPEEFPFYLIEVKLSRTAAYDAIASLPKGKKATAQQVSVALLDNERLFDFEKYCVTKVGDSS